MGIDIIFKIAGVGLITAIVNSILKKCDKDEIATFVTLAAVSYTHLTLPTIGG